ncbi:MAG: MarR family transcriptional regulator [Clostridiales bacterium]|nr:MarR family transcriptional regulator [Clostridiales bacterium]
MISKTNGGFLISQIKQRQSRIFERILSEHGIQEFNGAQGRILFVLWQSDNIPIVELSHKTGLAKTTLTSMLDRMENAGLLSRTTDPTDRRQLRIVLTEKSKRLNQEYLNVSAQMNELFYDGFTDEEIQQFETYLNRIHENLVQHEES